MPLKDHPAYKEEVERLAHTGRSIEHYMDTIEKNKEIYKDNIREAFVNLDYLDSSQSYIMAKEIDDEVYQKRYGH